MAAPPFRERMKSDPQGLLFPQQKSRNSESMSAKKNIQKIRLATPAEEREMQLNQPKRTYAQAMAQVDALRAARLKSSSGQSKQRA